MKSDTELREQLLTRRDELTERVQRIETELGHHEQPPPADFSDRASELDNLEVLEALQVEGRTELARVEGALARLDRGEYSRCARCGGDIAPDRLAALPYIDSCIVCAD